ncbi:MAG: hypothetical protein WAW86_01950 [Gammaproteobacteria bacterium]
MLPRMYAAAKALTNKPVTPAKPQHGLFNSTRAYTTAPTKAFDLEQYRKSSHFMLLPEFDQTSLKYHLFTPLGLYALEKAYITINQFLSLNVSTRETLGRLLAPQDKKDMLRSEAIIDRIFKNEHLNLSGDMFNNLKYDKREMLIRLYTLPKEIGLHMIEGKHITIDDYLNLELEQQQKTLDTLTDSASTYHLECHAIKLDSKISAIFAEKIKCSPSL